MMEKPFPFYNYIYEEAKQAKKTGETFMWPNEDALRQPTHPLWLKILCAFYILGHGESFHSCEGQTGIGKDTIWTFFQQFTEWMVSQFNEEFIIIPYDEQLVLTFMNYASLGLATGSWQFHFLCTHSMGQMSIWILANEQVWKGWVSYSCFWGYHLTWIKHHRYSKEWD